MGSRDLSTAQAGSLRSPVCFAQDDRAFNAAWRERADPAFWTGRKKPGLNGPPASHSQSERAGWPSTEYHIENFLGVDAPRLHENHADAFVTDYS